MPRITLFAKELQEVNMRDSPMHLNEIDDQEVNGGLMVFN